MCYQKLEQVIQNESRRYLNESRDKDIFEKLNLLPVREQMKLMANYPVKLKSCTITSNDNNIVNCSEISNITTSFDTYFYCLTFFAQSSGQSSKNHMIFENDNRFGLMVKFRFKPSKIFVEASKLDSFIDLHDGKHLETKIFTKTPKLCG